MDENGGKTTSKGSALYVQAVREALEGLSRDPKTPYRPGTVRYQQFRDPIAPDDRELELPCDDEDPDDSKDAMHYFAKHLEYAQTFLVADRLGKRLGIVPLKPEQSQGLTPHIERALKLVGRGTSEERETEKRRYYPFPYVIAVPPDVSAEIPFVDVAAFLLVHLADYLRWAADYRPEISNAARAEVKTTFDFLTSPDTYIGDKKGIGWSFLPPAFRAQADGRSIGTQRHIFPTARAVVAIYDYCQSYSSDHERVDQAQNELLPRALDWLALLRSEKERFFFATEISLEPFLFDHLDATEALLTLVDANISRAKPMAMDALDKLLDELDKGGDVLATLEQPVNYSIPVAGGTLYYKRRTTAATCLTTLTQAVRMLKTTGTEGADRLKRARRHCDRVAVSLLYEWRNDAGPWPRDKLQFHWTLSAVDALLRYVKDVPAENLSTTEEEVIRAADLLLRDERFIELFRQLLLEKLREVSRSDLLLEPEQPKNPGDIQRTSQ